MNKDKFVIWWLSRSDLEFLLEIRPTHLLPAASQGLCLLGKLSGDVSGDILIPEATAATLGGLSVPEEASELRGAFVESICRMEMNGVIIPVFEAERVRFLNGGVTDLDGDHFPGIDRLKLFIRWNAKGEGYHSVDLKLNGEVMETKVFCNNEDRVYGYCTGIVAALNLLHHQIEMPRCLSVRHACANHNRQD